MRKFLVVLCALALGACDQVYVTEGTVESVQIFGAGPRSICTLSYRFGEAQTLYTTRVAPINPDGSFEKCSRLSRGDRVPVLFNTDRTRIDWESMSN